MTNEGKSSLLRSEDSAEADGKVIGQLIAEKLGVKCYDKELLTLAAKQSGLCEELFETHDENHKQFPLFSCDGYLLSGLHHLCLHGYAD